MRWFQYKPGVVVDSLREAHCRVDTGTDDAVRSWCRRKFDPRLVEEANEPGQPVESGRVEASAPCEACLLLVMMSTRAEPRVETVAANGDLAVMAKKAQWLLDDAACELSQGRCSAAECEQLATVLEELAALIREQTARPAAMVQAGE